MPGPHWNGCGKRGGRPSWSVPRSTTSPTPRWSGGWPMRPEPAAASRAAFLLPLYDELTLSYPKINFDGALRASASTRRGPVRRLGDHRRAPPDRPNVGLWQRTAHGRRVSVELDLATSCTAADRAAAADSAAELARVPRQGTRAGLSDGPVSPTLQTHRAGQRRERGVRVAAQAIHVPSGAVRHGQGAAEAGAAQAAGPLGGPRGPAGPGDADPGVAPGPGARADPDPGESHDQLPVRVPPRHRDRDGRGRGRPAGHRHHAGGLRRLPPGQLRLLRLARGRTGDRPQRLRRGPSGLLGVGPAAAGGQHLGGGPGELRHRGAVRAPRSPPASRATAKRSRSWPTSRC